MQTRIVPLITALGLTVALGGCKPPPAAAPAPAPTEPATLPPTAPPAEAALPAADQIFANALEAQGGKAALEAITSSYSESKGEIEAQNITTNNRMWTQGDNFYLESEIPGLGTTQVWKNAQGIWAQDPIQGMRKLEGKEEAQQRWGAEGPLLVSHWKDHFVTAETIGLNESGERPLYEVKLTADNGQSLTLLFDAQSYMPAGQSFTQESPMGTIPVRVTQEDFREVQGVQIPFRSVTDLPTMRMTEVVQSYEVNVEVDAQRFVPPSTP